MLLVHIFWYSDLKIMNAFICNIWRNLKTISPLNRMLRFQEDITYLRCPLALVYATISKEWDWVNQLQITIPRPFLHPVLREDVWYAICGTDLDLHTAKFKSALAPPQPMPRLYLPPIMTRRLPMFALSYFKWKTEHRNFGFSKNCFVLLKVGK